MVTIKISTNSKKLENKFFALITKQYPFALAKTLTGLAYDVRQDAINKSDKYFDIKTTFFKNRGVRIKKANKRDIEMYSEVGVTTDILAKNITGGTQSGNETVPGRFGRKILNPSKRVLNAPRWAGKILRKKRPIAGNKNKAFVIKRGTQKIIAIRKTKDRYPLDILYKTRSKIKFKKRYPFELNARILVNRTYIKKLNANIRQAILTS